MSKAYPQGMKKFNGQEIIIEIEWWWTGPRNIAGFQSLYESCDRRMYGDGKQWATERYGNMRKLNNGCVHWKKTASTCPLSP